MTTRKERWSLIYSCGLKSVKCHLLASKFYLSKMYSNLTHGWPSEYIYTILDTSFVATKTISDLRWYSPSKAAQLHFRFWKEKVEQTCRGSLGELCDICCSTKQRFLFNKDFLLLGIFTVFVMWLVLDQGSFFEEATGIARLGRRDCRDLRWFTSKLMAWAGFTEDDQRSFRYHNNSYVRATFTGNVRWFGSLFLFAIFMLETFKLSRRS